MYENRKEKRNPEKLQVLLSSVADPSSMESALTENVSSRGLRLRTERPWTRDTCVIVLTCETELWARGRVAYCETLSNDTFAIGLELLAQTGASTTTTQPRGKTQAKLAGTPRGEKARRVLLEPDPD